MKKALIIAVFLVFYATNSFAVSLSKVERATNVCLGELRSYVCDVDTKQFENFMKKFTSGMPEDMPRPKKPVLKKYWHKKRGMVIRVEGKNIFPYMTERAKQMSSQFAVELSCFFLPMDAKKERAKLLKDAELSVRKDGDIEIYTITFKEKKDIGNLFFKTGLPIPTNDVKSIEIIFNEKESLLEGLGIFYEKDQINTVSLDLKINYMELEGKKYIDEINFKMSDESLKGSFKTEFTKIDKYYLPAKQIRITEGKDVPEENRKIEVNFKNYKLNVKIPKKIFFEEKNK